MLVRRRTLERLECVRTIQAKNFPARRYPPKFFSRYSAKISSSSSSSRLENRGKGKKKEEEGEERWSWKTCRSRRSEAVVFPRYSRASFTSKQRDQPSDSCIIGDPRTKCGLQRESSSFSLFFDHMKRMNSQCPIESSAEREDRREKIKVDSVPACSDPWPAE